MYALRAAQGQQPTAAFLGDEGRITLVSLKGGGVTGTLRMNGSARAAAFSPDGSQLLSLGASLPRRRLSHRFCHVFLC